MLSCRDSEIFIIIPMFIFLKKINNEDNNVCETFLPDILENSNNLNKKFFELKNEIFKINTQFIKCKQNKQIKLNKENVKNSFNNNNDKKYTRLLYSRKSTKQSKINDVNNKIDKELFRICKSLIN